MRVFGENMSTLVLLDSNSLLNRAFYAMSELTDRKGRPTGAIHGYLSMLTKLIDQYKPDKIVAAFDRKAPTFRKELYAGYKATRKPMPEDLAAQLQPVKDMLTLMGVPVVEKDGWEADDIIGTLARRFDGKTLIVTGDRDSWQLIDADTSVIFTKRGITDIAFMDEQKLKDDYGLTPSQIVDLKSLMGDSSDNIPGVPGVGEKTALGLLEKYGTLDGVYASLDEVKGKLHDRLAENKELAYLSYKLATIDTDSPIDASVLERDFKPVYPTELKKTLLDYNLVKLADKMNFEDEGGSEQTAQTFNDAVRLTERGVAADAVAALTGRIAFDISGANIAVADEKDSFELVVSDSLLDEGMSFDDAIAVLAPLLEDGARAKLCFDVKTVMHTLDGYGVELRNCDDVMLKAYLCDSNANVKSAADLFALYDMHGSDVGAMLLALDKTLDGEMREKEQTELYRNMELPLVKVLFDMEKRGFAVDRATLDALSERLGAQLQALSASITELAGEPFNLNSTKQLAHILFEKLGLRAGKKTKSGYSTNVEVLEGLKNEHPIVPLILSYRELSKLKSTYLDGMLPLIDGGGKIHTVFRQAVTATGRLSSTEPNLQNIPVRKESGREIRRMFVASPGCLLVCADYSQIELRLMAHFSGDRNMIDAFNAGEDFHTSTAAKLFHVAPELVTKDMRRSAKAVNFGIIYGISDYGLSEDLGVAVWQAREFMNEYFAHFPDVKKYMESSVAFAKEHGYVRTLDGRRRYIPELRSSNYNTRSFGERVAMNMPLQGTASDIIKKAMIAADRALHDEGLRAGLIMQVHDELIVDAPKADAEKAAAILKREMENAAHLAVPLIAEVGIGENWVEAK